jgi:hypothetical protein
MSVSRFTGYELDVQSSIPDNSVVHDVHHASVPSSTQDSLPGGNGEQSDKLRPQNTQCFIFALGMFMFVNFSVGRYNKTVYETRRQHVPPQQWNGNRGPGDADA